MKLKSINHNYHPLPSWPHLQVVVERETLVEKGNDDHHHSEDHYCRKILIVYYHRRKSGSVPETLAGKLADQICHQHHQPEMQKKS